MDDHAGALSAIREALVGERRTWANHGPSQVHNLVRVQLEIEALDRAIAEEKAMASSNRFMRRG